MIKLRHFTTAICMKFIEIQTRHSVYTKTLTPAFANRRHKWTSTENILYSPKGETDTYSKTFTQQATTLEVFESIFGECIDSLSPRPDEVITIGDYGAATGARSIKLFNDVIGFVKKRHGDKRQMMFVYNDLPSNDFNGLFQRLAGNVPGPESYLQNWNDVFTLATGKSIYQQVMPANSMDIVFSSYAIHYLSKRPCYITNGFTTVDGSEAENQKFHEVAKNDWNSFLFHRANELKPGGYLILKVPTRATGDRASGYKMAILWKNTLRKLLKEDVISEKEYMKATFYVYDRPVDDLRLPFSKQFVCCRELELLAIEETEAVFLKYKKENEDKYPRDQFEEDFLAGSMALIHYAIDSVLSDDRSEQNKMAIMEQYREELRMAIRASNLDSFQIPSAIVLIRKKKINVFN